ncbi:hypothetical protein [Methanobrevibacter sp.]
MNFKNSKFILAALVVFALQIGSGCVADETFQQIRFAMDAISQ